MDQANKWLPQKLVNELRRAPRPVLVVQQHHDFHIVFANTAAAEALDVTAEELLTLRIPASIDGAEFDRWSEPTQSFCRSLIELKFLSDEPRFLPRTNQATWLVIPMAGSVPWALIIAVDSQSEVVRRWEESSAKAIDADLRRYLSRFDLSTLTLADIPALAGQSPAARLATDRLRLAASSDSHCLIRGGTGCQTRLVADAVANLRRRRRRIDFPTPPIECSLFDGDTLIEVLDRLDDASLAQPLVLYDADWLAAATAERLCEWLENRKCEVIATADLTNRSPDVAKMLARLAILEISIEPLDKRRGDLPLIVDRVLRNVSGERTVRLTPAAADVIFNYSWRKNVDQLSSALRYAMQKSPGRTIDIVHLPPPIRASLASIAVADKPPSIDLATELQRFEARLIRERLAACGGNRTAAAKTLGLSRGALLRRITALGLAHDTKSAGQNAGETEVVAASSATSPSAASEELTLDIVSILRRIGVENEKDRDDDQPVFEEIDD